MDSFDFKYFNGDRESLLRISEKFKSYLLILEQYFESRHIKFAKSDQSSMPLRQAINIFPSHEIPEMVLDLGADYPDDFDNAILAFKNLHRVLAIIIAILTESDVTHTISDDALIDIEESLDVVLQGSTYFLPIPEHKDAAVETEGVEDDEDNRLSAFKDFINTLDLDDLDDENAEG